MNYWHLQMNQPWGRNRITIDSSEMLREPEPVIGTGNWEDHQCYNFTNQNGNGLEIDDIVLVREGSTPIALCRVIGENFKDVFLEEKFKNQNFRKVEVLSFFDKKAQKILTKNLDVFNTAFIQASGTFTICRNINATCNFIKEWYLQINSEKKIMVIADILRYKKQIILQGPPGTGKTREAELVAAEILGFSDVKKLQNNEQFKIIQFHPSYTYEDFVRGIIAEDNGKGLEYKSVNKTLGKFAELALQNYIDSKKDLSELSQEKWIDEQFSLFVDQISEKLENEKIKLTPNVNIVDIMEDAFLYIGENWKGYEHRMSFKDIKRAYFDNNQTRQDIVKNENLSGSAKQHATYYIVILKLFFEFLNGKTAPTTQEIIKEKKYILVIDEINRANLSSVLGELIYALEYRGKKVESMYEIDESRELVLPPNLYIIGTMNTADRSVGHIDYAIRRRFAFVDVLPKNLESELANDFKSNLFENVTKLFLKNYDYGLDYSLPINETERSEFLNGDFDPKDVWLGHSYFIQHYEKDAEGRDDKTKPIDFGLRLQYEIKPILLEYVKDGILKESAKKRIENLSV